jgi:F0F1-type ATP synthase assembly protein I
MSVSAKPAHHTPTSSKAGSSPPSSESQKSSGAKQQFVAMALTMSWQLALVVLVPVIGGVQLDKAFHTNRVWTFIGLGVALVGSTLVMWGAVQAANRLPVPKLTAAEKRKIQKQYEEDDD